jgi:hypothetical protein
MPTNFYNWRIATSLARLPRGAFPTVNLPPVVQWFPRDYAEKKNDAEGGVYRDGFMSYEILWTRLDQAQLPAFHRIFNVTIGGTLYLTGLWYDTNNPAIRWVDMSGKPDFTDPTPNVPAYAYGQQVFSTARLRLNNVVLVNDPAVY